MILLVGLLGAACARDAGEAESGSSESITSETVPAGSIRGTVRDASTDQPLVGAEVSAGALGARSDASGAYGVAPLEPGPLKLRAYRRGFVPESVTVIVESGVSALIDFPLVPAKPPCCQLDGVWSASFVLDSAGLNASPTARQVSGVLAFERLSSESQYTSHVRASTGESRVDFGPVLGLEASTPDGAEGFVFDGDSVAITVVPRFADWGVELLGRLSTDTIRGIWYQRASCCGAYGTFTLIRTAGAE